MKKLSKILATVAILIAPLAASTAAGATTFTCQVGYTGPDSTNMCVSETEQVCNIVNNNTVTLNNDNDQLAISGDGLNLDNTTSGSSTTGSATNSNGTTFTVTVTNTGVESRTCIAKVTVPATPVVTPVVTTTTTTTPKVLPNTSSNSLTSYFVVLAAMLGVGAAAMYLISKVYSRR